jgi:hypothetical protein
MEWQFRSHRLRMWIAVRHFSRNSKYAFLWRICRDSKYNCREPGEPGIASAGVIVPTTFLSVLDKSDAQVRPPDREDKWPFRMPVLARIRAGSGAANWTHGRLDTVSGYRSERELQ